MPQSCGRSRPAPAGSWRPRWRSAREAEQILQWAKFHPRGIRGINSTGVDGRYGSVALPEYIRRANADTFVALQIENTDALEDVEAIAAVSDVDVLFIGPADLSQSLGIPGQWQHPKLWQAIERVAQAAARTPYPLGNPPDGPAFRAPLRRARLPDAIPRHRRVGPAKRPPRCARNTRTCSEWPGLIPSPQSLIASLSSSELPFNSGAYMAYACVGSALYRPGVSARNR